MISKGSRFGVGSLIVSKGLVRASKPVSGVPRHFLRLLQQTLTIQFAMPRSYNIQDPEFLASLRKGDEAAFSWLFREYFRPLSLFASKIVSKEEAHDIVQNLFSKLWEHPAKFKNVDSLKSYLYSSIKNNCLSHVSKQGHLDWKSYLNLSDEDSIDQRIIIVETIKELHQFIDQLTPAVHRIMKMYYLEGKTVNEIADEIGLDPESVRRQRLRGVLAIRKLVKK